MPADGQEKPVRRMLTSSLSQRCPWLHVYTFGKAGFCSWMSFRRSSQILSGISRKYLDDLGIELATGPEFDFLAGGLNGLGITVIALGSHGIQRIGNRENAGAQRDLIALQTAGIPGPVVVLLVGVNDFGSLGQIGDSGEDLVAAGSSAPS